jgi:cytoskeletal protein CcmA (bactofilin family)
MGRDLGNWRYARDRSDTVSGRTGRRARESETESFIGIGMHVVGSVDSAGVVRVAGTVLGNVNATRQVLVAHGGKVDGEVHAREAVLDGEIIGSIVAERVEVQASAVIHGDITASTLMIHEGAFLDVELVRQPGVAQREPARRPLDKRIALALTS